MAALQIAASGTNGDIMSAKTTTLTTLFAVAAGTFAMSANAVGITRAFSGLWVDAAHADRFLGADVVQTAAGHELLAYWTTRDAAGGTVWIRASGPIVGKQATLDAHFGATTAHWGKVLASFDDCGHGTLAFQPDDRRQQMAASSIVRASEASATGCTGGLSDDHVALRDQRIVEFLDNAGVAIAASGKARFEDRGDRTDFKVEVEDLPIGAYSLRVGGTVRATLDVVAASVGTFAKAEFRSPVEVGKILLDFDPRGQRVEIVRGDVVYLGRTFAGADDASRRIGNGAVANYVLELETRNDGPQMRAELERGDVSDAFSVELEDFAVGTYSLLVDGIQHASIEVVAVTGGTEGEVEFRDPPQAGHMALDFDPRGHVLAIASGGSLLLSGRFPSDPSSVVGNPDNGGVSDDPPGDDHGGGNGNDDPPGDDHGGGNGNDDPPGDDHGGGNGNDDPPGDDQGGGNGNDDPPGDDHGGGNDDGGGDDHGGHHGHGNDD